MWIVLEDFGRYKKEVWCRERDSNPHEHSPLPPQDSVSTSSTTSANKSDSQYDKKHYIYKILIISWGLIPRPLGRKYLITIPIHSCLRRGSLIIYFCSYLILLFILF